MTESSTRKPLTAWLPAPMSVLLGVAFFLPWLRISCDAKALPEAPVPPGAPPGAARMLEGGEMATVSGWQLARGELTPTIPQARAPQARARQKGLPRARVWAYAGGAIPLLLLLLTAAALAGKIPCAKAGTWTAALAVGGVVVAILGANVDFVGDALDQAREEFDQQMSGPMSPGMEAKMDEAMAEVEAKLSKVVRTEATPWLWASMALWGGLVACGVLAAGGSKAKAGSASTEACRMTHTPFRADTSGPAASGGPQRGGTRPAPPPRPNQAPVPHANGRSDLPDFGPSLEPLAPVAAPAPATEAHSREPDRAQGGESDQDAGSTDPPEPRRSLCEPW